MTLERNITSKSKKHQESERIDYKEILNGVCRQIGKNIGTINDAIDVEGITDDVIKNQEWFTANLDYNKMKRKVESVIESAEPTDNQKKCIESFKTD